MLAEELTTADGEAALERFVERRYPRCREIWEISRQIGTWEIEHTPPSGGRLRRADDEVRPRHCRTDMRIARVETDGRARASLSSSGTSSGCFRREGGRPRPAPRPGSGEADHRDAAARSGCAASAARPTVDPRLPDVRAARRGHGEASTSRRARCTRAGTRRRPSTSRTRTRSSARTTTSRSRRAARSSTTSSRSPP